MTAVLVVAAGYVLGSLPFGYWAGRLRGIDLRLAGSGNTGATNVMRVLGLKIGIPVMALDIGKGAAAVVIARGLSDNELVWVFAAAAAVTGHMYPLFLGFKGGKGVATGAGTMLALVPWMGVAAFVRLAGHLARDPLRLGRVGADRDRLPRDGVRDRPVVAGAAVRARHRRVGDLAPPGEHRPPAGGHGEPHQPPRRLREPVAGYPSSQTRAVVCSVAAPPGLPSRSARSSEMTPWRSARTSWLWIVSWLTCRAKRKQPSERSGTARASPRS